MAANASDIDKRFIRKLKTFAEHGYAFDKDHSLRKGTRKDPDSKSTQREAFDAYTEGFEEGHRQGYLEIPTGVGKTALFIALAKNYLEAAAGEKDSPRVLIVVPSEKLAVQTAQSIAKFLPKLAPTIETDDDSGKEIDWENSSIGLQYGKVKHAERKPSVLITTYQSLNRDREDKTYPPSEYGMVIYDEGHALTAAQYGEAVEKFKQSIQLAVSATPEYSEEKTIAARLPHRYYQLPLADAINRGDLCNVRPVLLKTDYTIDERKFRKFLEQNNGRPLNDTQMTALLNQQVRNQAAMEAYLQGADPDSGERYLGQNGMIFCGSTDHVDDFIRQLSDLLTKPKYRETRQWLNEECIELIAPVHGKIKGSWLRKGMLLDSHTAMPITEGRRYNGDKEWYSEDEIFDLHAKGQILLLASVKKLKEGYDCPRDSIIIDTVDRLSKVDATQIDGRGFRLNPPNDDHYDPGNPDKTCTVINMVDKNTHALYADDPQMLPIYCAEVIEGAEFRTPARRKGIVKKFLKDPPEIDKHLESADFKLITDIETVRGVSRKYNDAKERHADARKKPDDAWSMEEFSQKLGGRDSRGIVGRLREQFSEDSELKEITYRGVNIPRDAFVSYISADNGNPAWAIKITVGQKILDSYPKLPSKPDDVWSSVELGIAMGLKKDSGAIKKLKEHFDANPDAKAGTAFGVKIPRAALVDYDLRGNVITGIKIEQGQRIAAAYKQSLDKSGKPEGVWSSSELAAAMDVDTSTAAEIIKGLQDGFSKSDAAIIEHRGVPVPRAAIVTYEYNKLPAVGITQAVGEEIATAQSKKKSAMRLKPDDVWSSVELARALGFDNNAGYSVIAALVKQAEENPDLKLLKYRSAKIPRTAIVTYDSDIGERTGIKQDAAQLIVQAQQDKKDKPDDVYSSKDFDEALKSKSGIGTGIIAMTRKQFSVASRSVAKVKGVEIPRTAWIEYEHNGKASFGIQQEYALKLLEAYGLEPDQMPAAKGKETLKPPPITPRKSPAHMTEEEREKQKRRGKGLGD